MKTDSRGNVLFLILIAVALFAALSYAVTSSTRSGGSDISKEKADLLASEIVQYANLIGNAALRLKISGCSDTEISFYNTAWVTDSGVPTVAENPNSPTNKNAIYSMWRVRG